MMARLAVMVPALVCSLALAGCWSTLPRQGGSATCSSNNHQISGNAWRPGVYAPQVGDSAHPKYESWYYAFDAWQDSYNTCGIEDDDVLLVTPTEVYRSLCYGYACQDGNNQVMDAAPCPGASGCAWTWSAFGFLTEADIFVAGWSLNPVDNRKVEMHEVGHAIGLCHNGACLPSGGYICDGNVMGYTSCAGEQLGRGDVSGVHLIYAGHTH
jgi:hypothetical protein